MSENRFLPARGTEGRRAAFALLIASALAVAAFPLDLQSLIDKKLSDDENRTGQPEDALGDNLDNSLDPDRYLVGGGDGFHISIKDLPSQTFSPVINSDGNLFIPEFGYLELGRIPLTQALARIQSHVKASLKGTHKVYVTLNRVKTVTAAVGGSAPNPGTYRLAGNLRILDLLKLANKNALPDPEAYDLRCVAVRNRDSVRTYDLLRALAGKDPWQNPYVYPGDQIVLRRLDRTISVSGHVQEPIRGRIPLVPGETAGDVLSLLSFRGSADTAYFLLLQRGGDIRKVPWAEAGSIPLGENDVLTIPAREGFAQPDTVLVSGEVARPGTYPVIRGRTTASELLEMAGGPTSEGEAKRGFVLRTSKAFMPPIRKPGSLEEAPSQPVLPPLGSVSVRPEISVGLNNLVGSNDFAVIELRDRAGSVALEDGDELHIPRREGYVYVSGSVKNPGAVPYAAGKSLQAYVRDAGGYTEKADMSNVVVVQRFKNFSRLKTGGVPEAGDVIMIPSSIQHKRLGTIYLPLVQTVATILSLALSFVVLFR